MIPIYNESYACKLTFYDKSRKLIATTTTKDTHKMAGFYNQNLITTPNEYYITLHYTVMNFHINRLDKASFIEVHALIGGFIARHFIRDGLLSPYVSYEQNKNLCPYIRLKQITSKPILDWRKINTDSFWNKSRNQKMKNYVK